MRRLLWASIIYMIVGLAGGLYYRELTKALNFKDGSFTQLAVVHTHLLTLGMFAMLIFLGLEKLFSLSARHPKLFGWWYWLYNVGIIITVGMMVLLGSMTVINHDSSTPDIAALSGIAGLGHILLTVALIIFFVNLHRCTLGKEKHERKTS